MGHGQWLELKGGSEVFQSLNIHIGIYVYTQGVELAKNTIYCLNIYKPIYINRYIYYLYIHTTIMRTYIDLTKKYKDNNNVYMRIYNKCIDVNICILYIIHIIADGERAQ